MVIPRQANAKVVSAMENVLDAHRRPCPPDTSGSLHKADASSIN
ncbi:MAG: hypothetical protein ACTXOO_01730 [Sodalis sp. (in: enterobacteria)]